MLKNRGAKAKIRLSMLVVLVVAVFCIGSTFAEDVTSSGAVEPNSGVNWQEKTENGKVNVPGIDNYGVGIDWGSRSFEEATPPPAETSLPKDAGQPADGEWMAILLAMAGVVGISAIGSRILSKQEVRSIIPDGNGIWVPEADRSQVEELINKAASKRYYIDENGFLQEVFGISEDLTKSSVYSGIIDELINGDKKIAIGIDSGWQSYNSETGSVEMKSLLYNGGGITVGDNGTDQVVVINGLSSDYRDIDGNTIYSGAEIILAHELIHALRGEYGLKSAVTGGVNQDEEAYTIQAENAIREELGYGLRGDGSKADDIDEDGRNDGDGSYGEYWDGVGVREWFYSLDESDRNRTAGLSGTLFSGANADSSCITHRVEDGSCFHMQPDNYCVFDGLCGGGYVPDSYCKYDSACGRYHEADSYCIVDDTCSHPRTDGFCGEYIFDGFCKPDNFCNYHQTDSYCISDSSCNYHAVDGMCNPDSTCNPHARDGYCAVDTNCNPHPEYDTNCGGYINDSFCAYDDSCGSHSVYVSDDYCKGGFSVDVPDNYCIYDSSCGGHYRDGYCIRTAYDNYCIYDASCGGPAYDNYCKYDAACNYHAVDSYCIADSGCNYHATDSYCIEDGFCGHYKDNWCTNAIADSYCIVDATCNAYPTDGFCDVDSGCKHFEWDFYCSFDTNCGSHKVMDSKCHHDVTDSRCRIVTDGSCGAFIADNYCVYDSMCGDYHPVDSFCIYDASCSHIETDSTCGGFIADSYCVIDGSCSHLVIDSACGQFIADNYCVYDASCSHTVTDSACGAFIADNYCVIDSSCSHIEIDSACGHFIADSYCLYDASCSHTVTDSACGGFIADNYCVIDSSCSHTVTDSTCGEFIITDNNCYTPIIDGICDQPSDHTGPDCYVWLNDDHCGRDGYCDEDFDAFCGSSLYWRDCGYYEDNNCTHQVFDSTCVFDSSCGHYADSNCPRTIYDNYCVLDGSCGQHYEDNNCAHQVIDGTCVFDSSCGHYADSNCIRIDSACGGFIADNYCVIDSSCSHIVTDSTCGGFIADNYCVYDASCSHTVTDSACGGFIADNYCVIDNSCSHIVIDSTCGGVVADNYCVYDASCSHTVTDSACGGFIADNYCVIDSSCSHTVTDSVCGNYIVTDSYCISIDGACDQPGRDCYELLYDDWCGYDNYCGWSGHDYYCDWDALCGMSYYWIDCGYYEDNNCTHVVFDSTCVLDSSCGGHYTDSNCHRTVYDNYCVLDSNCGHYQGDNNCSHPVFDSTCVFDSSCGHYADGNCPRAVYDNYCVLDSNCGHYQDNNCAHTVSDSTCVFDSSCGHYADSNCPQIMHDNYCVLDSNCGHYQDNNCSHPVFDSTCVFDSSCGGHYTDSNCHRTVHDNYCVLDSSCNYHPTDSYCDFDSSCGGHFADSGCTHIEIDGTCGADSACYLDDQCKGDSNCIVPGIPPSLGTISIQTPNSCTVGQTVTISANCSNADHMWMYIYGPDGNILYDFGNDGGTSISKTITVSKAGEYKVIVKARNTPNAGDPYSESDEADRTFIVQQAGSLMSTITVVKTDYNGVELKITNPNGKILEVWEEGHLLGSCPLTAADETFTQELSSGKHYEFRIYSSNGKTLEASAETYTPQANLPLTITHTLRYGENSNEVKELQKRLLQLGLDIGNDEPDGFGKKTLSAVVALQINKGLVKDGLVGTQVRDKINELMGGITSDLKSGLSGIQDQIIAYENGTSSVNGIKYLQSLLKGYIGLDLGTSGVDGVYGNYTKAAVKAIQQQAGLSVTGVMNSETWTALYSAIKDSTKYQELRTIQAGMLNPVTYTDLRDYFDHNVYNDTSSQYSYVYFKDKPADAFNAWLMATYADTGYTAGKISPFAYFYEYVYRKSSNDTYDVWLKNKYGLTLQGTGNDDFSLTDYVIPTIPDKPDVEIELNGNIVFKDSNTTWEYVGKNVLKYWQGYLGVVPEDERTPLSNSADNLNLNLTANQVAQLFKLDPNGVACYMLRQSVDFKNQVFKEIFGRDPDVYRHKWSWGEQWAKIPEGESADYDFWKGDILSESEMLFGCSRFTFDAQMLTKVVAEAAIAYLGGVVLEELAVYYLAIAAEGLTGAMELYRTGRLMEQVAFYKDLTALRNLGSANEALLAEGENAIIKSGTSKYDIKIAEIDGTIIDDIAIKLKQLRQFAAENGIFDLQWSFEKILSTSGNDLDLAKELILATKEIQAGKSVSELARIFKLPENPAPRSLSLYQSRVWYLWQESQIASKLDYTQGFEQAARQAYDLRNYLRTLTRESMSSEGWCNRLMAIEKNKTWDQLVTYYSSKGFSNDDLWKKIIEKSMSSRDEVNEFFKLTN